MHCCSSCMSIPDNTPITEKLLKEHFAKCEYFDLVDASQNKEVWDAINPLITRHIFPWRREAWLKVICP